MQKSLLMPILLAIGAVGAMEAPKKLQDTELLAALRAQDAPQVTALIESGMVTGDRTLLLQAVDSPSEELIKAIFCSMSPEEVKPALFRIARSFYESLGLEEFDLPSNFRKSYSHHIRDNETPSAVTSKRYFQAKEYLPNLANDQIGLAIQNSVNRVVLAFPEMQGVLDDALLLVIKRWHSYDNYRRAIQTPETLRPIKRLICLGANVNIRVPYGISVETPLHTAAFKKHLPRVITLLIESGADKYQDLNSNVAQREDKPKNSSDSVFERVRRYGNESVKRAFITAVSPQEVQHVIAATIALTNPASDQNKKTVFSRDLGKHIASYFIPAIVNEKMAMARKYLYMPKVEENELRAEIMQSIKRVLSKKSCDVDPIISFQVSEKAETTAPAQELKKDEPSSEDFIASWLAWLLYPSSE